MDKFSKEEFRKLAKNRLKNHTRIFAKSKNRVISDKIFEIINFFEAKNVLIFTPLKYEPDLLNLRRKMKKSVTFYLPFMLNISLKMVKFRLPLKVAKFEVKQSSNSNAFSKGVDLAVIPTIAVDGKMARIGHGKGFYDMFFSMLKNKPIVVFVEICDLFCNQNLCEKHDIVGDFYITAKKNYMLRGKYDRNFSRLRSRISGSWRRISSS